MTSKCQHDLLPHLESDLPTTEEDIRRLRDLKRTQVPDFLTWLTILSQLKDPDAERRWRPLCCPEPFEL